MTAVHNEEQVQALVRLNSAREGFKLFRNNTGVAREMDEKTGRTRYVRYGLCNDSAALNKNLKSGDLVGWRSVIITPDMVGRRIAIFASRECKAPGWRFSGNEHEAAQLKWANLVNEAGGDACFVSNPDEFVNPHFHLRHHAG